jgi:hypothetical protein
MRLLRACFVVLAILVPASWTVAHAGDTGDMGAAGSGGGKKSKKKSSKKKDTSGSSDTGSTDK